MQTTRNRIALLFFNNNNIMTMRDAIVVHSCDHLTPHLPYFDFRYVFLSIVFRVANGPKYRPIVEAYGFVAASRFQFKTAGTSGSM